MYIIYASETAMLISVCIVCEQTNSSLSGGGRPARSGLCFTEPSKKRQGMGRRRSAGKRACCIGPSSCKRRGSGGLDWAQNAYNCVDSTPACDSVIICIRKKITHYHHTNTHTHMKMTTHLWRWQLAHVVEGSSRPSVETAPTYGCCPGTRTCTQRGSVGPYAAYNSLM